MEQCFNNQFCVAKLVPITGSRMTLPSLLVSYTGDPCVFPSDSNLIADSLATSSLDRALVSADHYGFPVETGREVATRTVADWITAQ